MIQLPEETERRTQDESHYHGTGKRSGRYYRGRQLAAGKVERENFTMVMLADLENCSLSFTELTEKLSALGAEMDIAIRMQREDIFNAMHKI